MRYLYVVQGRLKIFLTVTFHVHQRFTSAIINQVKRIDQYIANYAIKLQLDIRPYFDTERIKERFLV